MQAEKNHDGLNESYQDTVQKVQNYWREIQLEENARIDNPKAREKLETPKNKLRKQVKSAKKTYHQDVINGFTNKTVFQTVKWPNTIQTYTRPLFKKRTVHWLYLIRINKKY